MADPPDLGFSEFVAKLISETFTAVVESTLEQERRYGELAGAAALPLEDFAREYVDDSEVKALLRELFPPPTRRSTRVRELPEDSAADAGQPYTPGTGRRSENPPLLDALGIEVEPEEVEDGLISTRLAERVQQAARLQLARSEWLMARAVVSRGVPRVMVDSGHIMAKQTYEVVSASEPEDQRETTGVVPPTLRVGPRSLALERVLRPTIRPDLLIRIKSPRATEPTSESSIYGEVQVTFKTVP